MCFFMLDECIIVNEGLRVKLYPDKVMKDKFNQSLGNARFVWNNLLTEYQKTFELFKQHDYTKLKCNQTTFHTMLTMLKNNIHFCIKVSQVACNRFIVTYYTHLMDFLKTSLIIQDLNPKRIPKMDLEYKTIIISK